jgi:hypothetical protein
MSKRPLLIAALASLSATAAIAIGVLLFGDFGTTEGRILGTTLAVSLYSLLTMPGSILVERRIAVSLGWATIGLGVVAFLLAVAAIWELVGDEPGWKLAGIATAWAAAGTQISALTSRRRGDDSAAVRSVYVAACALGAVLATLVTFAIAAEIEDAETFFRVLAALAVLNVFLLVLQPILRRLRGGAEPDVVRVVLEGSAEQIEDALRRLEGSGVIARRG